MKTSSYQQADAFAQQSAVTIEFPDTLPENEAQCMEYEKIREEIQNILQHAAIEYVEDNI